MACRLMDYLRQLKNVNSEQLITIFEFIPDILFWVKDTQSQILYANQAFLDNLGVNHLNKILGQSDYAFSPHHIAKQFIRDDQRILAGELVTNRIEMNVLEGEDIGWFTTTKRPLRDDTGTIIGSYGYTRSLGKTPPLFKSLDAINIPLEFIKQHYQQPIAIETLAEITCISISALERRFKKHLGKTPKQFINEFRLEQARKLLLETQLPIAEVAYATGFTDHSYFCRQYKKMFDEQPSEIRQLV